jgi:hypothetical protein
MNTYNIPDSNEKFAFAKQQYNQLSKHFPDLFLAGGYLRDLVYDKSPKDLDFYFRFETVRNFSYIFDEIFPKELNLEFVPTTNKYPYSEYIVPYTFINTANNASVQLIGMHRSMNQILAQFDLSFNQIFYDGYRTFVSDLFLDTLKTKKVMPVTKTSMKAPGMIDRISKFQKKFPDLDFNEIIPLLPKVKPTKSKSGYSTAFNFGPLFAETAFGQQQPAELTITTTTA